MSDKPHIQGRDIRAVLNGAQVGQRFDPIGYNGSQPDDEDYFVGDDNDSDGDADDQSHGPNLTMQGPIKTMDDAAYHGVLGRIAREVGDYIEADTSALLITLLVATGVAIGRKPFLQTGPHTHHALLNAAVVAGTGQNKSDHVQPLFCIGHEVRDIERQMAATGDCIALSSLFPRILSGLSTGEGLYYQIRDAVTVTKRDDQGNSVTEVVDEGVEDKRMLVIESELARVFAVMTREHNTLSQNIRELFDCKEQVQSSPKTKAITVTEPFVGFIGLITPKELGHRMKDAELYNGFANRWMFPIAWRAHSRPFPPDYSLIAPEHAKLWYDAVSQAQQIGKMTYSRAAARRWERDYELLRRGWLNGQRGRKGMAQEAGARAHAVVMRISVIFAAMDGTTVIGPEHQAAAFAVWDFSERSIAKLFAGLSGDPVKDVISERLRTEKRMTRVAIRELFNNHIKAVVITTALKELEHEGKVRMVKEKTIGRPAEVWEWIAK